MPTRNRRLALAGVLVLCACAATTRETYDELEQAMEAEVEPLVEKTIPIELNKNPDNIDFEAIRSASMSVSGIFVQTTTEGRNLYQKSEKTRAAARTAARWFQSISVAALHKDKAGIVSLYGQKQEICSGCHDY